MEIKLKHGLVALVDPDDDNLVRHYKWTATFHKHTHYAITTFGEDGNMTCAYMHRIVGRLLPGERVDHKNHNGLDNRQDNLRKSTIGQNYANARINSHETRSGYRCVWPHPSGWHVVLRYDGRRYFVGRFDTKEEAAAAHDVAAVHLWGEFALLNNPPVKLTNQQVDYVLGCFPVVSHEAQMLLDNKPHEPRKTGNSESSG